MATCNVADHNLQAELETQEEKVELEKVQTVDISNHWQITMAASCIGHGVYTVGKKGVGVLKNKFFKKKQELDEDFKLDFCSTCEAFDKQLRVLCSNYIARDLDKTREQFMKKQILIGVIGFFNTGKSTLLNSLLKARLLPMKLEAETSVQVLIQHIRNDLPQVQSTAAAAREHEEPILKVPNVEGTKVVRGAEPIYKELQTLNGTVRSDPQNHIVEGQRRDHKTIPACTLLTCVPFLADAPNDWYVKLVDTPGFGESESHVELLATEAQKSSSAYVYVTTYENLNAQANANCLKSILARDQGVFKGSRLIIVVTKFDQAIESAKRSDPPEEMTEEKVKKQVFQFVHRACGVEFSNDDVLVVSGWWAYNARMLDMTPPYGDGPSQLTHKRYQDAVKRCLHDVPNATCGQGEDPNMSLDKLGDDELSAKLEKASGIVTLEERIKTMTKSCVAIWVGKIKGDYERYSKAVCDEISQASSKLSESIWCDEEQHRSKMGHLKAIYDLKKELKENRQVYEEITRKYQVDLQHSKAQQTGKSVARDLVAIFRDQCVEKVKDKKVEFGPRQLEAGIKDFLEMCTKGLDETFSSTCTFPRMTKVLMQHVYEMKVKIEEMRKYCRLLSPGKAATPLEKAETNAQVSKLLGIPEPPESPKPPELQELEEPPESPEPPELQELEEPPESPEPPELQELEEPPESPEPPELQELEEPPESPEPPELQELEEPPESPEPPELQELEEPPESPESPEPPELQELEETLEPVNLLEPPVPPEPPKIPVPPELQVLDKPLEPQNTPELLETLDLLQPLEPLTLGDIKEKMKIPKWNDELEETIKALRQFLEEQCDAYFVNIKKRAVKYFHDQYRHETRTELAAFDAKFKEDIYKQKEEIKKLKKKIEDNRSKVLELKEMCGHFKNLEVYLNKKAGEYLQTWRVA